MKFCYCPECKELHPRNWHSRNTCDRCRGSCAIISVPTSFVGYLMYVFSIFALALIALELLNIRWALSDLDIPLVFGAVIAGFICSYYEIGRGTRLAYEQIDKNA